MQIILGFVPLLIIIILMILFKINIRNKFQYITNMLFYGTLSIILTFGLGAMMEFVFPAIAQLRNFGSFIYYLLFAGIIEEVSKFVPLMISRPKSNKELIVNSILIATFFSIYEHYIYLSNILSNNSIFIRLVTPGHALYLLIPVWFIVLGKKINHKYLLSFIGLLLGILVHSIYDKLEIDITLAIIFGIIGYIAITFSLYKASKMDDTIEVKNTIFRKIFVIFEIICIILFSKIIFSSFNMSENLTKMNTYCHNEKTKLDVKVVSAESINFEDTFGDKNHYIRLEISVKNNSDSDIEDDSIYNYNLVSRSDNTSESPALVFGTDTIELENIKMNDEISGYLYYKVDGKVSDYIFKYKTLLENNSVCIYELK